MELQPTPYEMYKLQLKATWDMGNFYRAPGGLGPLLSPASGSPALMPGEQDMRVDRLRMVERVLGEVDERRLPFDISVWLEVPENACGSAGCAIGWAARDPEVVATGLRLVSVQEARVARERMDVLQHNVGTLSDGELEEWRVLCGRSSAGSPIFGDTSGFDSVYRWLELPEDKTCVASWLFLGDQYCDNPSDVTPEMVRRRVQQTIEVVEAGGSLDRLVDEWEDAR